MKAVIVGTTVPRRRRPEVVIVHKDERALMTLAVALSDAPYEVTASEPADTLQTALRFVQHEPAAMIVALRGNELINDIRDLLSASDETAFVFLIPEMPPRAALARVMNTHGAAILCADEPTVVVVATLVALLASRNAGKTRQSR